MDLSYFKSVNCWGAITFGWISDNSSLEGVEKNFPKVFSLFAISVLLCTKTKCGVISRHKEEILNDENRQSSFISVAQATELMT